jgi:hypothetical protein
MPSPEHTNRLSQLSLYYLVGSLYFGGVGLLASPGLALKLLLSTGDYGIVMPRMAGLLMLGLGTIVLQIIRHEIHSLYSTAIVVRALFCVAMVWFYALSGDRLFLVLLGIIGTGVILTASGYALDRRRGARLATVPSAPRGS